MSSSTSPVEKLSEEEQRNSREIEMENLIERKDNDLEQGTPLVKPTGSSKGTESISQKLLRPVDEMCNVKVLMRTWGPRLEFVVRLMLVSTYFDDSFRMAMNFSNHIDQVSEYGYLTRWMVESGPGLAKLVAAFMLLIGLLTQLIGSVSLLVIFQPDIVTKMLIAWTIAQPVLYAQLSNIEFVAESFSLIGGLFMLRAHLVHEYARDGKGAMTQLLGRLLLPTMYLYYSGKYLHSVFILDETSNIGNYISSLSMFVVYTIMLIALVIGSMLVAAGLQSRIVAFLLALVNISFVFYQHPFFLYLYYKSGEWKVKDSIWLLDVALPKYASLSDFDMWQIYDLHKYYFFLGLSTSGALLLLVQLGPGQIAIQKDEKVLPVRAQD
mmetsp:Transcript_10579/g.13763  ORF Transcript_10579/g.13763 Transcript_10579/m.13763 type:complete len:381 (+) Transcript_10579:2186-3328(+)